MICGMSYAVAGSFLGLDAAGWTAVATVALVLVTIAYVVSAHRMAGAAEKSARDSADAAASAKEAAGAMKHANELQLAQLLVDFTVTYRAHVQRTMGNFGRFTVTCTASTVYFHQLRLLGTAGGLPLPGYSRFRYEPPTDEEMADQLAGIYRGQLCPIPPSDHPPRIPFLMQRGESVQVLYPEPPVDPSAGTPLDIDVLVLYSLSEQGDVRSLRRFAKIDRVVADPMGLLPSLRDDSGS